MQFILEVVTAVFDDYLSPLDKASNELVFIYT